MNRVLLCGVCVSAVRCLLEEEDASVTVVTAQDGSLKTKVSVADCRLENGIATAQLCKDGNYYQARAWGEEQPGICLKADLENTDMTELIVSSPGLVSLLLQNIALQLENQGVEIQISVRWESQKKCPCDD